MNTNTVITRHVHRCTASVAYRRFGRPPAYRKSNLYAPHDLTGKALFARMAEMAREMVMDDWPDAEILKVTLNFEV